MDGTIQAYVLDMAADTKKEPLRVKQYDTNSRQARITLKMGGEPWTIPFGCQIHINVRKTDGTLADAACTRIDEHTVLTPITEQMTAVTGTQLGELYFLGSDGDIKSQSFPVVVYEAVMDQARMESSDDFQSLQDALRDVKASTDTADIAAQYATEQGNSARDAARQAENAAGSIQAAVDAAAAAKVSETNAKTSETASAQTKQEVTDYVEAQKAAFVGYSKRESDSRYANALTNSVTGEGGVTVEDAWTAPVLGLDVVGKSEQATTTGAQLLPQPQFNDTKNGITVKTQMDGGISITGTATSAIAFTVAEILLPAGTYILSGLSGLVVDRMYFQLVEISAQGGQFVGELAKVGPVAGATVTIDRDVWARAEIKVLSGVTADSICYPMLNAGDTALPWEPYTGGAPSPSPDYPQDIISTGTVTPSEVAALKPMLNAGDTALPWEPYTGGKPSPSVEYPQTLELVVTGAQMFYKSLVTLQGTGAEADITDKRAIKITYTRANGGKYAGFIVDDKSNIVGKTLTISYGSIIPSKSGLTPGIRLYWIDINGSVLSYVVYVNKSPTTITIEDPQNDMATKLALLLYADIGDAAVVNDYVIYKDIMINAGDTPLPWEPYKDRQTAPVTLTEPLHGTGECRDRIACKDGEWGIERYIGVVDNGQWRKLNVASGSAGHRFVYDATDMIEKLNCMVICSKYTRRPKGASFNAIGDYVATDEVGKIFIRTLNPDFETIEAFREFIADAITLYPLAVPTWTPLPSATQQALNELTTYAGTTHLTITAGGPAPTVTLDYVKDTHKALEQCQEEAKEYTDNQIAAIVAALPTATQAAIVDNQTTKLLQEV